MKLFLSSLCVVFAVSQVRLVAQPPTPGGVLISVSDEYGVRVADRPAIVIDTDKIVVPSLYLWGANEIRLTHRGTVLQGKRIYKLKSGLLSIITFEPPLPPDEVQTIETTFEHGVWLQRDGAIPVAEGDARVRTLHVVISMVAKAYAVTPDVAADAGSAYHDADGALVGILSIPAAWHPSNPDSMILRPGQELAAYVAKLSEREWRGGETWATWLVHASPSVSEFSRLFLERDARPDELERIAAKWNEEDPGWTRSLPQELYFVLFAVAANNKIASLQDELIQHPPEFWGSGADRYRLVTVGTRIQQGPGGEDMAELHAISVEDGPTMFLACVWMAEALSQMKQPPERVYQYLKRAGQEFKYDPILYKIGARMFAEHAEHDDDEAQNQYTEMSERRQALDWSVSASLTPATQLLEWELYEQAAEFARTGVERWPDDVDCREALVRALVGLDDIESAREHLIELRRRDPERATKLVESIPSLGNS